MKKSSFIALCLFFMAFIPFAIFAQNDTTAIKNPKWDLNWVGSLNGSQAEYSNWSQGGASSIAATASTVFEATFKHQKFGYSALANLKYGQTKIDSKGVQKTDDLIRLTNKFNYFFNNESYSAFTELDFRTQFDDGFDKNKILISRFFAPAFVVETAGFSYKPNNVFTSQAGLSLKQTIVSDTSLAHFYGVTQGQKVRGEGGLSLVIGIKTPVFSNLSYSGKIETFTNFLTPVSWTDYSITNEITGKINSTLSTVIQFSVMYDRDFNDKLQIKQVIALGLSFKFL